jgi:hypothetical protein
MKRGKYIRILAKEEEESILESIFILDAKYHILKIYDT